MEQRSRPSATERSKRLELLGYQRLRLLRSLGGDEPHLLQYFDPAPGADVLAAFRNFVRELVRRSEHESDPLVRSLIGAGQLLTGDLSGASEILAHLPVAPFRLDHGMGYAAVVPVEALLGALPLPDSLKNRSLLVAGSPQQAALREWLARNQSVLIWDDARGTYSFAATFGDVPPAAHPS